MLFALIAEAVRDFRRTCHKGLVGIDFAVEDAKRGAVETALAVVAEFVKIWTEIVLQRLAVRRTALRAADRIQAECEVFEAERLQEVNGDEDDLGVDGGIFLAERLDAELVEFAHAAGLRTVIAEHRADIEQLDERAVAIELVLEVRAHGRCRVFGAERDAAAAAVFERVHLLVDNVGAFADAAVEELRMLEHRRADLLISIAAAKITNLALDVVPLPDLVGQDVIRAARCICQHGLSPSFSFP